ncbi:Crp/Fnr family transcriptional regulator [Salidesulfovibrio onnuriiensis]|uniref:Crp/Fnr family transcriptional regulator n=1 Tax=Salidesulfovibrio onnuriiensis TaxID=2583823 RepID=UPI0011C9145F|nr:Crp/Fnr family transcriptional regulator [Salidesulfovibrio onnuriiensis]
MTKHLEEAIGSLAFFESLEQEQIARLAQRASVNRFPRGAVFYSEDKASKGLHILLSGKVKLFKMSEDGKEQTIFIFGAGEPFCLCSAFSDGKLPANMAALEDSEVLVISPDHFESIIKEDPTILLTILKVMSRRLKDTMVMIDSLALKNIPARLAAYLLSREHGGTVELGITYRELSKILGVTPEALSRALKKMTDQGMVETRGATIRLADMAGLHALSEGI